MDKYDLSNIEFILSLSETEFKKWWGTLTEDDKLYSESILTEFNSIFDKANESTNQLFKDLNI